MYGRACLSACQTGRVRTSCLCLHPQVDWGAMQKQKDTAVAGLTKGIEGLLKKNKAGVLNSKNSIAVFAFCAYVPSPCGADWEMGRRECVLSRGCRTAVLCGHCRHTATVTLPVRLSVTVHLHTTPHSPSHSQVDYVKGWGKITGPNTVEVASAGGCDQV